MGYHEASAISNAPAKDQKCHKLTFSIHSLFIQRVSIPFLSGLSSNMLVMIQQVWNCVLVLFVQKLWIFWHLSCLTLMFVSMFDLLSTDKAQNLSIIWKDFLIFLDEVNFGDNFMTVCCWILNLVLFTYRKGKRRFQSRCCRKTSLLTPLENMHLAIFLLIYQFDLSCWVYISKSPKGMT